MGIADLKSCKLSDFRFFCFFLACLLYGVFGSPTPNAPGIVEIAVGCLLVFAAGGAGCARIYRSLHSKMDKDAEFGALFLLYGFSVPLLIAFLYGHAVSQIVRDVLPFLFLFFPLVLSPLFYGRANGARLVLFCMIMVGLLFSVRSLVSQAGVCGPFCGVELLYLENMPTVLFSCLFLTGAGMRRVIYGRGLFVPVVFWGFLGLAALPFMALLLSLQRASLSAVVLYCLLVLGYYFYIRSARAFAALVAGVIFVAALGFLLPVSSFPVPEILGKTALVGFNNRPQEAAAVWEAVAQNPATLLFGLGWGGHFNSPAVGGLSVNFTHNFFTTMLLKTGVCGLIFSIVYIAGMVRVIARVVVFDAVLGLALAAPFFIDILLYASFKSLDFGLTLLMIRLSLLYCFQSESFQSSKRSHASPDHTLHEPSVSTCARRDGTGFA